MDIEKQILDLVQVANPVNPVSYVHNIIQDYALKKHNQMIMGCKDCDICNSVKTLGHGNSNAQVLIIGDNISENDITNDEFYIKAFNGECVEILSQVFEKLKINTEELFFANAIACWPYKKIKDNVISRPPNKAEIKNCSVFINHLIEIIKPRAIILLGNVALNIFKDGIISKNRGEWFEIKGIPTMATYHPQSFINPKEFEDSEIIEIKEWEFFDDIKSVFNRLKEKYPDSALFL